MPERLSSFFILLGALLLVLALWYGSYRLVGWDTRRRGVRAMERKAWIVAAIVLPIFGCALYLFVQALRHFPSPPSTVSGSIENDDFYISSASQPGVLEYAASNQGNQQVLEEELRQSPMPEPAWGNTEPAHSNGKAHTYATPETIRAPYKALRTRYSLFVVQGPHQGQLFLVKTLPLRIGRGSEVEIALDEDLNISRKHAEIYEWSGRLRIRDLGSVHGILINGVGANDQALSPGDRITLGGTILILRELP